MESRTDLRPGFTLILNVKQSFHGLQLMEFLPKLVEAVEQAGGSREGLLQLSRASAVCGLQVVSFRVVSVGRGLSDGFVEVSVVVDHFKFRSHLEELIVIYQHSNSI